VLLAPLRDMECRWIEIDEAAFHAETDDAVTES
jgi:hypothetical protein